MNVSDIIDMIIRNEGGFVNHPNDRGGPTNMGITQHTLEKYLNRPVTITEMRNLEYETAYEIYERDYITGPRIDTLPLSVQPIVADSSVLYGPKRAIKFLQNIVNAAGFSLITVDGVLGPNTRKHVTLAYNEMGPFFINAYVEERIMFCERIVANNPSQSVFLKGWINRANKFRVTT
jgi:lysozyme family protein